MSSTLTAETDLAALFGLEMDNGAVDPVSAPGGLLCPKCSGRGKFIGRNGNPLGPCFSCDGSGLTRSAGITLAPGACVKCVGTGQWRPGRPCFACQGSGVEIAGADITVDAIATAFGSAFRNGIKSPKLRLGAFVFSRAPDHGRNAGAIYVKSADTGEYLGKCADGQFHRSADCDAATAEQIIAVASDPHNAARAYGQLTGSCSVCNRVLTAGISIDDGIGPICREKFGW